MSSLLNVEQAVAAAGYDPIDEDAVYATTGNPRPADIREALTVLLTKDFDAACKRECVKIVAFLLHMDVECSSWRG